MKVVSQRIGHADVGVTLNVHAHVMPGDDEAAAVADDGLLRRLRIPRWIPAPEEVSEPRRGVLVLALAKSVDHVCRD